MIVLDQFPIAPSANNMFPTVRVGRFMRRVKSGEYKQFEKQVAVWAEEKASILKTAYGYCQPAVDQGKWIQTRLYFCLPRDKVYTKAGTIRKWDACNRVKATHDALAKVIGIDDTHFALAAAEKVLISRPECTQPYTLIILQPATMIEDKHIIEEVLQWPKSTARSIL